MRCVARYCCDAVRGKETPACLYDHCTRPEQSKPVDGLLPPQT